MDQQRRYPWPGFPERCRLGHPWEPGAVLIAWQPCECLTAAAARGGHLEVSCASAGCTEIWQAPRHESISLPKLLGHHRPDR